MKSYKKTKWFPKQCTAELKKIYIIIINSKKFKITIMLIILTMGVIFKNIYSSQDRGA